jgi:GGDEF domain-containing protein
MERMRACLAGSVLISQKGSSMSFTHDGLHDGLTRLAAPPHFYEILRREIALTNRNFTDLTAIRVILNSKMPLYEATLISFADLITNSFRYEDAKARLGEFEFGILIRGDEALADQLSRRLVSSWTIDGTPESTISYASAKYSKGESAISFINRLDDQLLIQSYF